MDYKKLGIIPLAAIFAAAPLLGADDKHIDVRTPEPETPMARTAMMSASLVVTTTGSAATLITSGDGIVLLPFHKGH